jgi:parvulin-like peptidyl-prolyl isomerase
MKNVFYLITAFTFLACHSRPEAPIISANEGLVIAKVDGSIITDKMLKERIAAIEKAYPRSYTTYIQQKALLGEMMNIELLYREAVKLGLEKKYEFKSRLADLYVRELSEKARSEISDDKILKFFEANRAAVEQISVRHILLKVNGERGEAKKAIRNKLEGLRAELIKNPEQFADYARKYSEDGSRDTGGELGFFQRPLMVKEFSDAAFSLKKINDISPVIETQYGFHIIQLIGDRRGYEPYKDLIREQFLRQTQKARLEEEIERLKKGKEYQIYEDQLVKSVPLPKEVLTDPKELIPEGSVHGPKSK